MNDIDSILESQKDFFKSNKTKELEFRLKNLIKLKEIIEKNEKVIFKGLKNDLGKSEI